MILSSDLANKIEKIETSFGVFGLLKLDSHDEELNQFLSSDSNIEYIEPNWIIELDTIDNSISNEPPPRAG